MEPRPTRVRAALWAPWLLAAGLLGLLAWRGFRDRPFASTSAAGAPPPALRFTVALPAGWHIGRVAFGISPIAISPDGRTLALRVVKGDTGRVFLRPLDGLEWKPVAGTDGANGVAFSDDGRFLVLGARLSGKLVRVPVEGGPPTDMADGRWSGALGADGTLYFVAGYNGGIRRIDAPGATPTDVTKPDRAKRELGHWWPQLLPDGKHLLFSNYTAPLSDARLEVLGLDDGSRTTVARGGVFGRVVGDVLLYVSGGTLQAAPFDMGALKTTRPPQPVLDDVAMEISAGVAAFAVSETGTLAYVPAGVQAPERELVWVDRAGRITPVGARGGVYIGARLSPDGDRIGVLVRDRGFSSLWIHDVERGILTPFSRRDANTVGFVWSRDGRELFYNVETPTFDVFRRAADGASPERLLSATANDKLLSDITPDGRTLLVEHAGGPTQLQQVATIDVARGGEPTDLNLGERGAGQPTVSPDGRWLAYVSAESGDAEVFVRSYPDVGRVRRQVSTGGARTPRWTRGGRELLYIRGQSVMSAGFDPATGTVSRPVTLFDASFMGSSERRTFDVTADGERFVMVRTPPDRPEHVVVVGNWLQNVKAGLAARR